MDANQGNVDSVKSRLDMFRRQIIDLSQNVKGPLFQEMFSDSVKNLELMITTEVQRKDSANGKRLPEDYEFVGVVRWGIFIICRIFRIEKAKMEHLLTMLTCFSGISTQIAEIMSSK